MTKVSLKAQILIFLAITFSISWVEEYFIIKGAGIESSPVRLLLLMWTPGLTGIFLSGLLGSRFKDLGFKIGPARYYAFAYAVPALAAVLILCLLLATGLGAFEFSSKMTEKWGSPLKGFLILMGLAPTLGVLVGFASGIGEEIGWRGFLHSKMVAAKIPHPYLLTGLIWSVWHWPLILFSNYASSGYPVLSVLLFTIMVTSFAIFMGWLREGSGSVFTAGVAHGAHNVWIQAIYPAFLKKGPLDPYFGGESGVFNAALYLILAVFLYRKVLVRQKSSV